MLSHRGSSPQFITVHGDEEYVWRTEEYPSDADKLVFAIFDRDFKSNRSDYCSAVARIPLPPASFDPCFHDALANTQRLCSQVQRF